MPNKPLVVIADVAKKTVRAIRKVNMDERVDDRMIKIKGSQSGRSRQSRQSIGQE